MVKRYTGWEMFPLPNDNRNDGSVYVKAIDYDALAARLAKVTRLLHELGWTDDAIEREIATSDAIEQVTADSADAGRVGGFAEFASGGRKIEPGEVIEFRPEPEVSAPVCKCDMRTKLVGDGCAVCNPELAAEYTASTADDGPNMIDLCDGELVNGRCAKCGQAQ